MAPRGVNSRPTPSGFMMNGPIWSLGAESGLKSGTSTPAHFCVASFHHTCRRLVSQGLPSTAHDARLYSTRRFIGQDQAKLGKIPSPEGSSSPRLCISAPASVHEPQYSQLPLDVVPSSLSQANPGSCCPCLICCLVFGSSRSASALPLISFATSLSEGL